MDILAENSEFLPFTATHYLTLVVFFALIALWCVVGKHTSDIKKRLREERFMAFVLSLAWLFCNGRNWIPSRFDVKTALPLDLCDLTSLAACALLFTGKRWLSGIVFYLGIGLSSQALITPDLRDGIATDGFWSFWMSHWIIYGVGIYDLVVRRYRPRWRDWLVSVSMGVVYISLMFGLNILIGSNYGYVGAGKPKNKSLIDLMGPWPFRALIIVAAGVFLPAVLGVPFWVVRLLRTNPNDETRNPNQ